MRGGGGLINLEETMVSVLHRSLLFSIKNKYKVKSSSTRGLEVLQPRIRIQSELPVGK